MGLKRRMAIAGGVVFASAMFGGRAAWAAVDVCSLLPAEQVAALLGVPEVSAGAAPNRCIWAPKKYKAGAGDLTVIVEGANDPAKMMGLGTSVTGISDEAIQTNSAKSDYAVLHVRKGNTWFNVSVSHVPLDQATKMEQAIAPQIASRL
jgi:hypothetical protein